MIKQLFDWHDNRKLAIAAAGGATLGFIRMDLAEVLNRGDQFILELKILSNGTAPGASKTLTMYFATCSAGDASAAQLASCADSREFTLRNAASAYSYYMHALQYVGAQYLYVWYDCAALDPGAALTLWTGCNVKRSAS